jgi:hypothetical protein
VSARHIPAWSKASSDHRRDAEQALSRLSCRIGDDEGATKTATAFTPDQLSATLPAA